MKNEKRKTKNKGQSVLTAVIFFVFLSLAFLIGMATPAARDAAVARALLASKRSFYASESGVEDVSYRVRHAQSYDNQETLDVDGATVTTTVTDDVPNGTKDVVASADSSGHIRKSKTQLTKATQVSFAYGIQAGNGGLLMKNSSLVNGNVYANGPVQGFNSNLIRGTVVSASASGLINGSHATSSAFAHTISDSTVEGDAYFQTISNTTVLGTQYPNSPDKPTVALPISDDTITSWEDEAEAGGVISTPCPYKIKTDTTIGPKKINCDLEVSGSPVITLTGIVWVSGNITIKNTPTIKIDPSFGKKGVAIIADNRGNRTTSSQITLSNSVTFLGSGTSGSFVLLLSQNSSSEGGGSNKAIDFDNTAAGDVLLYAGHGHILMRNQSKLKSIAAYKLELINNTEVVYDSGLESSLFDNGPGGSWDIIEWQETE